MTRQLPVHIISQILSFISAPFHLSLVCKQWKVISYSSFCLRIRTGVTEQQMNSILKDTRQHLKEISLRGMTWNYCMNLLETSPSLRRSHLLKIVGIPSPFPSPLPCFESVETLDWCFDTDFPAHSIFSLFPNLRHLTIMGELEVPVSEFFSSPVPYQLESLSWYCNSSVPANKDLQKPFKLRKFQLTGSDLDTLYFFLIHSPELECLSIKGMDMNLPASEASKWMKNLTNVRLLILQFNFGTDSDVYKLMAQHMKYLQRLDIWYQIGQSMMTHLVTHLKYLQQIFLEEVDIAISTFKKCKHLKHLDVETWNPQQVTTDQDVIDLCSTCTDLTYLALRLYPLSSNLVSTLKEQFGHRITFKIGF
eukprot:TRINITY_DN1225_c0_g1_i1.p1 TRINITY_DN1225_c0_g1~~TRINITY_DN1225_c0_g1_i1.p1  ORF type:complete len:364 (-),score=39.65 TRINITY_DN1225_c0_g1_i1:44-1135(-)